MQRHNNQTSINWSFAAMAGFDEKDSVEQARNTLRRQVKEPTMNDTENKRTRN